MCCHMGIVRVRRSGCPSRQGACLGGGGCTWAITFSSSTLLAAFSSSTCTSSSAVYCCFLALERAALSLFFTCSEEQD